jgi:hypothetical protein
MGCLDRPPYLDDATVARMVNIETRTRGSGSSGHRRGRVLGGRRVDHLDTYVNTDVAGLGDTITFGGTTAIRDLVDYEARYTDTVAMPVVGAAEAGTRAITASRLLETGTEAANGGVRFIASSDGVVTDLVGSNNAISIGHHAAYVRNMQGTGARTFSSSDEAWNAMTPAEQWMRNQRFLDDTISRDSEIQSAMPLSEVN